MIEDKSMPGQVVPVADGKAEVVEVLLWTVLDGTVDEGLAEEDVIGEEELTPEDVVVKLDDVDALLEAELYCALPTGAARTATARVDLPEERGPTVRK